MAVLPTALCHTINALIGRCRHHAKGYRIIPHSRDFTLQAWTQGVSTHVAPTSHPRQRHQPDITCEVLSGSFLTSNSIDVNNTGNPNACPAATDNHTATHSVARATGLSRHSGPSTTLRPVSPLPPSPTPSGDYSIAGGGGLLLEPASNRQGDSINPVFTRHRRRVGRAPE